MADVGRSFIRTEIERRLEYLVDFSVSLCVNHKWIANLYSLCPIPNSGKWMRIPPCRLKIFCGIFAFDETVEPGFRRPPFALHSDGRQFQHLCGFFNAQAAEEAQFDDFAFAWVEGRKAVERVIERHKLCGSLLAKDQCLIKRYLLSAGPALFVLIAARMIDEDVPHDLCGDGEKVCAVLPVGRRLINQSQVGFVDQS